MSSIKFESAAVRNVVKLLCMDLHRPFSPKRLAEALRDGSFGLPDFQRPSVWTAKQQIKLLESLCEDLPIGVIIASKFKGRGDRTTQRPFFEGVSKPPFTHLILDGQQRLRALSAMCSGADPNDLKQLTLVVTDDGRVIARRLKADSEASGLVPIYRVLSLGSQRPRNITAEQWKKLQQIREALNRDSIQVLLANLRDHAQAVELFERINSRGSRLAVKDLVAARLAEAYPAYITRCERISRELSKSSTAERIRCFDRMVLTKVVAFAATGKKTARAKDAHGILLKALHGPGARPRALGVKGHVDNAQAAGRALRQELAGTLGLAGDGLDGVLDGNAAVVAMQYLVTHKKRSQAEMAVFRRWLFCMLFSTYYTGGGTEMKVDEDLQLISARIPKWKKLFEHAQEGAAMRGIIRSCNPRRVVLNKDVKCISHPRRRPFLEALRRITIANQFIHGWYERSRRIRIGDPEASLQHIMPRNPRGSRRWKLGREVIEHPANWATIHKVDNSTINNREPEDYLREVSSVARVQQHIPKSRKDWTPRRWNNFLAKRTLMIIRAAEKRVNRASW